MNNNVIGFHALQPFPNSIACEETYSARTLTLTNTFKRPWLAANCLAKS